MDMESLSLQDLADATGVEPRTIRSYVEKGVIPGPDTLGRGARYPRESLERLQVFQLLRDAHRDLSLDQIRLLMQSLTPAVLSDLATGRQQITGAIATSAPVVLRQKGDALEYLRNLKASPGTKTSRRPQPPPPPAAPSGPEMDRAPPDLHVLEQTAKALTALVVGSAAPRSARGSTWYRIRITHDIELSVRGEFPPEQLAQLHRIADALKLLLTKGPRP